MILWSVTKLLADIFYRGIFYIYSHYQHIANSFSFVLAQGPLNLVWVLAGYFQEENIETDFCFKDIFQVPNFYAFFLVDWKM